MSKSVTSNTSRWHTSHWDYWDKCDSLGSHMSHIGQIQATRLHTSQWAQIRVSQIKVTDMKYESQGKCESLGSDMSHRSTTSQLCHVPVTDIKYKWLRSNTSHWCNFCCVLSGLAGSVLQDIKILAGCRMRGSAAIKTTVWNLPEWISNGDESQIRSDVTGPCGLWGQSSTNLYLSVWKSYSFDRKHNVVVFWPLRGQVTNLKY